MLKVKKPACPTCDGRNVKDQPQLQFVEVGTDDEAVLLVVVLPVLTCEDCDEQWTDYRGESQRDDALWLYRRHLDTIGAQGRKAFFSSLRKCRDRLAHVARTGIDGILPTPIAVERAETFLKVRPMLCSVYRILPDHDGSVSIELDAENYDVTVEFGPTGKITVYSFTSQKRPDVGTVYYDDIGPEFLVMFDELTQYETLGIM